jgi:hypothetical protein
MFDGSNDWLWAVASWPGVAAGEAWIVFQLDADAPLVAGNGLWRFGTAAGGSYDVVPYSDGHAYDAFGSTTRKNTTGAAIKAWERARNRERIKWLFTVDRAREKLGRSYPAIAKRTLRRAA